MRFPRRIRLPDELYANPEQRFHLTMNSHPEVPQFSRAVRDTIWQAVMDERRIGRVELFAACLMPDHLHLLVRPDKTDIIRFVNAFKSWTTRQAWSSGAKGAIWQPSVYDRIVRGAGEFDDIADYIVRNPVVAGMVDDPRDWPHTWAWWWE
jgi:REP element-mobilizing transposase RayT